MQFDESHPRLKGFNAYYENTIRPGLKSMEARRQSAVRMGALIFAPFFALGCVFGYLAVFMPVNSDDNPYVMLAGVCFVGGWFLAFWKARSVKDGFDGHLAGAISKFLGLQHFHKTSYKPIGRFRDLSLLPSHDRSSVEDEISGVVEGVPIRLVEAHLEERRTSGTGKNRRTRYVTVFRGLLVEMHFHKNFSGRTVISKDGGWFEIFKSWGMPGERVKMEDPRFEDLFEVYSSDQVEARYLLTPAFMERVIALSHHFGRGMQLAFDGGRLYLAGPRRGDMFEAGSIFSNLTDPGLIRETLREFGIVFDIIDTLKLTIRSKA